jgi:hypothetical protein
MMLMLIIGCYAIVAHYEWHRTMVRYTVVIVAVRRPSSWSTTVWKNVIFFEISNSVACSTVR